MVHQVTDAPGSTLEILTTIVDALEAPFSSPQDHRHTAIQIPKKLMRLDPLPLPI